MSLIVYSIVLNHHQAPVADELYKLLNKEFCFVELMPKGHSKGDTTNYATRPFLLRAWESQEAYTKAMALAKTADVCIFSGVQSLPFMKERIKLGLFSLDMSERWLKQGIKNIFSPALSKQFFFYWLGRWDKKALYKLCMSGFAADDHQKLGMYKGKCYKWGYFTSVGSYDDDTKLSFYDDDDNGIARIMWCARFIDWKHPELAIQLAEKLKNAGYDFQLDMYGDGPLRKSIEERIERSELTQCVKCHGNVPNDQIHQAMREHDIFLFTSDRCEGWGAVANEAMSEGCCLIGSDEIGAVPYLVKDNVNGLIFKSRNIESLFEKTVWAIEHPEERKRISIEAYKTMHEVWSPENAAKALLLLIDNLQNGKDTPFVDGPCSKA